MRAGWWGNSLREQPCPLSLTSDGILPTLSASWFFTSHSRGVEAKREFGENSARKGGVRCRSCPRNCKRRVAVATCHWLRKAPGRPDSSTDPRARRPAATENVLGRGAPVGRLQQTVIPVWTTACVPLGPCPQQCWGMPMSMFFRPRSGNGPPDAPPGRRKAIRAVSPRHTSRKVVHVHYR